MSNILNATNRIVDLDDGRILAPGELAENIDLSIPHNGNLIEQGLVVEVQDLVVVEQKPARRERATGNTGEDSNS